jgi:hypothetical protein
MTPGYVEPRAQAVARLGISSSIRIADGPESPPKADVTQARIALILDDVGDNIGALIATLNAAIAMRNAADNVGLIYSLRRARPYWKFISASAAELVAADARQEGGH